MNSEAVKNYGEAASADLDNRLKATSNYYQVRQLHDALAGKQRGPRATSSELAQYAHETAPKRLTTSDLDVVTGEINWPTVLNDDRYAKQRQTVDRIFSLHHASGGGGAADYRAISEAIEALRGAIAKNIGDYSPAAYMEARNFLDSLQHEAHFVTD
jgi:hypothetical protein